MNPNRILAKKLRSYRIVQGLSQEAFAERCGLHRTYIGAIERGERNVTLDLWMKSLSPLGFRRQNLSQTRNSLSKLSKELLERVAAVTNKRAKIVVDHIVKNGAITTEELKKIGYDHPPRAARDVRELGINLKTTMVKSSSGKRMGAYSFDTETANAGKLGRKGIPKKVRDKLIADGGSKCNLDGATHNLQVDHRIPYEVAGETLADKEEPFQVLCGSCNRQKSWECEHCHNWIHDKDVEVCRTCYCASSEEYTHVAMRQERRVDLVWTGSEVKDFETLSARAKRNKRSVAAEAKLALKN